MEQIAVLMHVEQIEADLAPSKVTKAVAPNEQLRLPLQPSRFGRVNIVQFELASAYKERCFIAGLYCPVCPCSRMFCTVPGPQNTQRARQLA